jgi:hypothetical protein
MIKEMLMSFSHLQRRLHKVHRPRLRAAPSLWETEPSTPRTSGLSGFLT